MKLTFPRHTWIAILAVVALAAGCKISNHENSENKKVSIEVPGASIHVDKGLSAAGSTDLPEYPGAVAMADPKESRKTVEIASPFGQLEAVHLAFSTPDASEKVIAFYRQALSGFGTVLECKGSDTGITIGYNSKDNRIHGGGDPVYCTGSAQGGSEGITLKVGRQDNAHMVHIHGKGAGTGFTLVRVRTSSDNHEPNPPGRQPS